jgi:prephenate dehydratase
MAADAPLRVAFLGPAGTYTEEALVASAQNAAEPVPCDDVEAAVGALRSGAADAAVVPIENAIEGSVTATLDVLARGSGEVRITAEVVRPIRHCLIANEGAGPDGIARVLSHPQALAQCAGSLRDLVPAASTEPVSSTAEAVRLVGEGGRLDVAAIGSSLAAERYGCTVLAEGLEDEPDNVTRFVWLAADGAASPSLPSAPGAARKTSIVFWGFNDESPGALVAVLSELADRGINLTKIESRPQRVRLGHYMFFADLEGGEEEAPVAEALAALGARVETLLVLGSYPVL